jgi:hypothetical protein
MLKQPRNVLGRFNDVPLANRFWSQVRKTDGCWIWEGVQENIGYGRIREGGRSRKYLGAHRVGYQLRYGPIPIGLCVLHHCDNRLCVNPKHLFLGTRRDNHEDMMRKARNAFGEAHGSAKLTWEDVMEIRRLSRTGRFSQRQLGKEFRVSQTNIGSIVRDRLWKGPSYHHGGR